MSSLMLDQVIRKLIPEDDYSISIRAFMRDEIIWKAINDEHFLKQTETQWPLSSAHLTPANAALFAVDPDLVFKGYPETSLPASDLEEAMLGYENYLVQKTPVNSIREAGLLAIGMYEKFRQAQDWSRILYEICDVVDGKTAGYLINRWTTPLVILSGLLDDPRDLFQAIFQCRDRASANKLLPHLVLSMPANIDEQTGIIVNTLLGLPVSNQAAVMRYLAQSGDRELLQKSARGLLSRHLVNDLDPKSAYDIWNDPQKYLEEGNSFRDLAVLAQFAGDYETAEKLLKEHKHILKAELAGNLIQSAALKLEKGFPFNDELDEIPEDIVLEPKVSKEIAALGPETVSVKGINKEIVEFELNEAVKMFRAGNKTLAQESAKNAISKELNGETHDFCAEIPLRAVNRHPGETVGKLIEMEMWPEASAMIRKLLEKMPTDTALLSNAALVSNKLGDRAANVSHLEKLNILEAKNDEFCRQLAAAYLSDESWQSAFQTYQRLIDGFGNPGQEDLLGMAKSALKCENFAAAQQYAQKVLAVAPENHQALAISGYALFKQGNPDKALALLDRSVQNNPEDCEPWMLRADLYAESGDTNKSVSALRSALTAHPEDDKVKTRLARTLVESGQPSEALTVLEGGLASTNKEQALLKLQALKKLNLPDLANYAEQLYQIYPDDGNIRKEYLNAQLGKGNRKLVKDMLESVSEKEDNDLKLAYCDSVMGEDYHKLHVKKYPQTEEQEKAENILQQVLLDDPRDVHARMLMAESLIHKGKTEKAFEFLTSLVSDVDAQNSNWLERIRAGFTWAASLLGKADLALDTAQNIVQINPDWTGAAQTLAEIDAAVGDVEEAVSAATNVLETAADMSESVEWFADFMSNLGREDEAGKILEKVSKTRKDRIPFLLKLVEIKSGCDSDTEVKEYLDEVKNSLTKIKTDGELLKAAKVFNQVDDPETAQECLQLRLANDTEMIQNAYTDLAGFKYTKGEFAQALDVISQAREKFGPQHWLELLEADTLHASGDAQRALELLSEMDAANEFLPETGALVFAPDQWVPLLQPQASTDALIRTLAFESGNYREVLEYPPGNPDDAADQSVLIEAGFATGNARPLQPWLSVDPADERVYRSALLAAQVAEMLLDEGDFERAALIVQRALELHPQDRVLLANASRYSSMIGDVNTAEALFDQILPAFSREDRYATPASVCALRALIKSAAAVNRWNEALTWQRFFLEKNQQNLGAVRQSLETLVRVIEFSIFTEDLGIRQHFDATPENMMRIHQELHALLAGLASGKDNTLDHWVARAKTALEPNQANVRSMALKTPDADDVAAMMLALHRSGQTATALQLAGKFSGDPRVMYAWAYVIKETDPQKAIDILKKEKKSALVLPWSSVLAQLLYRQTGESYSAINEMEEAVQWWPNEPEWHTIAAECWQKTGDLQNAIRHLDEAQKLLPEDGRIKYLLGKAHLQSGDTERSIQMLEEASKNAANHYETWETLAEAYYSIDEKEKALQAAEKASSINGFSVKPTLLSARINLDKGDVRKALELAQSANKHDGQDVESLIMLAKSWLANNNKLQAMQALEQVSHARNASVQILIDQAKLIQQINGAVSAKVMLEALVEKYPENIEVLNMLAEAQLAGGDKNAARTTAQRSLKLQEFQPKLQHFIGKLDLESGHLDEAIHHFSQAIAQELQSADVYMDLGEAYVQQRDFESALSMLDRAIELAPGDIGPLMAQANLLRNGKDFARAENRLRKAAEIDPNDLNIRRQLGAVIAMNLVHSSQEASSRI